MRNFDLYVSGILYGRLRLGDGTPQIQKLDVHTGALLDWQDLTDQDRDFYRSFVKMDFTALGQNLSRYEAGLQGTGEVSLCGERYTSEDGCSYLQRDENLLLAIDGRSPYSYYTIRGIDHRLEMTWMWCWPWESTARVEFIETIPRIDGRVNGDYAEAARALYGEGYESPPKWQGGRYTATMVKENNQWHIRSLSLVELLDGDEGDAQP